MKPSRPPGAGTEPPRAARSVLVGREHELELLDDAVCSVGAGRPSAVAIGGELGIGKTRLLSKLQHRLQRESVSVLRGRGVEFDRTMPFAIWREAIEPVLEGSPAPSTSAEIRRALKGLRDNGRVAVLLDDVHRADAASLELVGEVLADPGFGPLLLAITYRDGAPGAELVRQASTAPHGRRLCRLRPRRLTLEEAAALIGGERHASVAAWHEASGGNPFHLLQLANAGAGSETRVPPPAVVAAVAEELRDVAPATATMLRAAAVLGRVFELRTAAEVAQLTRSAALTATNELLARGLIDETEARGSYAFQLPVVRAAVYEVAGEGWRIGAHARAARALAAQAAPLADLATHIERSAQPGDEDAVARLSAAADEVAHRAPAESARWYEAAVRLIPAETGSERRLALLTARAESLLAAGQIDGGQRVLDEALVATPSDHVHARVRILSLASTAAHLRGAGEQGERALAMAIASKPEPSGPIAVRLELERAIGHCLTGAWDEMAEMAAGASRQAAALEEPGLLAEALALGAVAGCCLGHTRPAESCASKARVLLSGLTEPELTSRLGPVFYLGWAAGGLERYADSARCLQRGLQIAQGSGRRPWAVAFGCALASVHGSQGKLAQAVALATQACAVAEALESEPLLAWSHATASRVTMLVGDLPSSIHHAERATSAAQAVPSTLAARHAHYQHGALQIATGSPAAGIRTILAAAGEDLRQIAPGCRSHWCGVLCEAELARGDRVAAERWASVAEAAAAPLELDGRAGLAMRSRAAVLLAREEPQRALEAAAQAAARLRSAGQVVEAARVEILAARALVALDSRPEAAKRLDRARSALSKCGARGHADEAAQALRAIGRRRGRRVRSADPRRGPLTARELEVARLVAVGRTNRQIAASLFVSPKTVEVHLSHIFEKLRVHSRVELARAMAREQAAQARAATVA